MNDSGRKRRKSVTFSLVTQTVGVDGASGTKPLIPHEADPSRKPPLSNASNTLADRQDYPTLYNPTIAIAIDLEDAKQRGSWSSSSCTVAERDISGDATYHDDATPSPRKRRFSRVSHPPPTFPSQTTLLPQETTYDFPEKTSPRKRRLSNLPPNDKTHPTSPPSAHGRAEDAPLVPQAPHNHHSPPSSKVLCPPTAQPPPDVCATVNARIRTTFDRPAFDFAQHAVHRTYVVRRIHFSPTESCVAMLDAGVDGLIIPHGTYAEPRPPCAPENFSIAACRGKGKGRGMFAQRPIRTGEVVLTERPVIVTPYVIGLAVPLKRLYADMFGKLDAGVLHTLMELAQGEEGERKGIIRDVEDVYEAIMRLHALAIDLPVPAGDDFAELPTHRGVFLNTSRCNHSCGPNAQWTWHAASFALVLTAVRAIQPGEEITIAYVKPQLPYKERREVLWGMYGFECKCTWCVQPPARRERSDEGRAWVAGFWGDLEEEEFLEGGKGYKDDWDDDDEHDDPHNLPTFETWCADHTLPAQILVDAHLKAVDIIEREGLHVLGVSSLLPLSTTTTSSSSSPLTTRQNTHPHGALGRHVDALAMCYGALEDVDNFRVWIGRAAEAREGRWKLEVEGEGEKGVKEKERLGKERLGKERLAFRTWMSNPVAFPVWGWRTAGGGVRAGAGKKGKKGMSMFEFE